MVLYEVLDAAQVASLVDDIRDLYAEVFAEPPYCEGPEDVARFAEHFAGELAAPGFTLARATDGAVVVGAAYGWTMPAGRWFSQPATPPPAEIVDRPHFAVMEWMVRPGRRGEGIGRRLMELLLDGRTEPWAMLAANPEALARSIYERWGWRLVGPIKPPSMPTMDVLALPLDQG